MMKKKYTIVAVAGLMLAGCTQSALRLNDDFGRAVRADVAAQIADPDAHYAGAPAPGSNGARVGLAQKRYETNKVIPPATVGGAVLQSNSSQQNNSSGNDVTPTGTGGTNPGGQ